MKRGRTSIVLLAALAPLLGLPSRASAQGKWKEIGTTSSGNAVFVDTRSVKRTGDLVAANVRVVFKEPVTGARSAFSSYRTSATFNCTKKSLAAKENVYYADAKSTRVVDRTVNKMPGFGPALGGSLGAVALNYLCAK